MVITYIHNTNFNKQNTPPPPRQTMMNVKNVHGRTARRQERYLQNIDPVMHSHKRYQAQSPPRSLPQMFSRNLPTPAVCTKHNTERQRAKRTEAQSQAWQMAIIDQIFYKGARLSASAMVFAEPLICFISISYACKNNAQRISRRLGLCIVRRKVSGL